MDFYSKTLTLDAGVGDLKKEAKQDGIETHVVAFDWAIKEAVSDMNKKALSNITREILPNRKATFKDEECPRIKKYAKEELSIKTTRQAR